MARAARVGIGEVVVPVLVAAQITQVAKERGCPVSVVAAEFRVFREWVDHKFSRRARI